MVFTVQSAKHGLNKTYHSYDCNPNMMLEETQMQSLSKCQGSHSQPGRESRLHVGYFVSRIAPLIIIRWFMENQDESELVLPSFCTGDLATVI